MAKATPAKAERVRRPGAWGHLRLIGPGLVLAATGVGAGDLVAASVSGSRYGFAVIWAGIAGALLKFGLSEGLARWQLASGTTLLEGWTRHLGRWVQYGFLVYLVLWSFIVGGALISACGLAAHALVPALSVRAWGAIHSILAAALVLGGKYESFERLVKVFIGLMTVTLVGCALFVASPLETAGRAVAQAALPAGSTRFVLAVMGGVGGSVTMLSYGYWIREKRWEGRRWLRTVQVDLGVAYGLTGLFAVAVMVLAAWVLYGSGTEIQGSRSVLHMAAMVSEVMGPLGRWTFLVGFWGAVATSMLGTWQGVPYLFCDFVGLMKRQDDDEQREPVDRRSIWYRLYLGWLCLPTMLLLFIDRPVAVVVAYSMMSALFMPFLAGTLLYLNSRSRWVGELRNGWVSTLLLLACLALFGYLGLSELVAAFGSD